MNKRFKLLIIDDETDLLEALAVELKALNFEILTAQTGHEALSMIKSDKQIIAVLSDIAMPEMSGVDCLKSVRATGNEVPFVFLTGHGRKDNLTDALRLGAMDFLEKPCPSEVLLSSVRSALRLGMFLHGLEEELEHLVEKYRISDADQERLRSFQRAALTGRVSSGG